MFNLEELIEKWSKDSKIDTTELGPESTKTPQLHAYYVKALTLNNMKIRKLDLEYRKMRTVRDNYYEGRLSKEELDSYGWPQYEYTVKTKSKVADLLEGDPVLLDIITRKIYHEEIVNFCTAVLKELNNRTWQIKTAVEWAKFTQGG